MGSPANRNLRWRSRGLAWLTIAAALLTACATATTKGSLATPNTTWDESSDEGRGLGPASSPESTADVVGTTDGRELLAQLAIDDQPHTSADYERDAWHHWDDIDGDGCDARQQALRDASVTPAQLYYPCQVVAGDWISAYDGFASSDPGDLDIDHVVPLENAHISGGWAWTAEQRRLFANDQFDLWVVSAASNRSKGKSAPDEWRPPDRGAWCEYAVRWVNIKLRWGLSARTSERDALGQMLDTCAPGTVLAPTSLARSGSTFVPPTSDPPISDEDMYFESCSAARAAGVAPIRQGQPGYRERLDGDRDGVACE